MSHSFRKYLLIALASLLLAGIGYYLYFWNIIPHVAFSNKDFNITPFTSSVDCDGDGIDDQSDILMSARDYLATNPQYKSVYYAGGYPTDEYGVCTDVVAYALLGAGYDLQALMDADIRSDPEAYGITTIDKNIDFRRVVNQRVYLERHAVSLPTDLGDIASWQGGDIVVYANHVGIVSDKRNHNGIPFVLHNGSPQQHGYEQDILEFRGAIVGHYRISE